MHFGKTPLKKLDQQGNHSRDRFCNVSKKNRESIRKSHPQMAFQILCLAIFFRVTHDPYEEFFAFVS